MQFGIQNYSFNLPCLFRSRQEPTTPTIMSSNSLNTANGAISEANDLESVSTNSLSDISSATEMVDEILQNLQIFSKNDLLSFDFTILQKIFHRIYKRDCHFTPLDKKKLVRQIFKRRHDFWYEDETQFLFDLDDIPGPPPSSPQCQNIEIGNRKANESKKKKKFLI